MRNYLIVEFSSGEVEVVCGKWFESRTGDREGVVYWPQSSKVATAVRKQWDRMPDWTAYPARVLYECDDFDIAKRKVKKAEETSNLSTAESDIDRRTRHARHLLLEPEVDSVVQKRPRKIDHSGGTKTVCAVTLPPVPARLRTSLFDLTNIQDAACLHSSKPSAGDLSYSTSVDEIRTTDLTVQCQKTMQENIRCVSNVTVHRQVPPLNADNSPTALMEQSTVVRCSTPLPVGGGRQFDFCSPLQFMPSNVANATMASLEDETFRRSRTPLQNADRCRQTDVHGRNLFMSGTSGYSTTASLDDGISRRRSKAPATVVTDSSALPLIIQQLAEIKEEIRQQKVILQEVVRRQRGLDNTKAGRLPDGIKLPLMSVRDVQNLEEQLRSQEVYSQLVAHLSLIGGTTCKDCTSNVMMRLLDNTLAKDHYNWTGRADCKQAFGVLTLKHVVIEAVRRNPLTSRASDSQIEGRIKKWLRGACDRKGGRTIRAKTSLMKTSLRRSGQPASLHRRSACSSPASSPDRDYESD